ncbi:mechanosensitive ion channel family protein [Scytonema hofmannii]|nr:mechanosensitive ion channel family protein [Scytonema hofmannii]
MIDNLRETLNFATLLLQLSLLMVGQFGSFLSSLVTWAIVVFLIYITLFYGLRLFFRRREREIAIVALNVSQVPLLTILILSALKISMLSFGNAQFIPLFEKVLSALIVAAASYWSAQLFTQVIAYYLKKYAQNTEAMWDDVLVPLLETTLPLLIYIIGGFLFLQSLGLDLTGLWVAFGGATFVLGFALKDILANFFSGLVLLIDTPFQFGDVISLSDGSVAVIKKIGVRLTKLLLIDTNCEIYIPNGSLESQKIINLSRPAPHYCYSLSVPLRVDVELGQAISILKEVVLAHPDTLGNIDCKLQVMDNYYKFEKETEFDERRRLKKETGRERLLAEKKVNKILEEINQKLRDLSEKIKILEKDGLDIEERRNIQNNYLDIIKEIGLEVVGDRQGKRRLFTIKELAEEDTLINSVRTWYKTWLKDPDLTEEDPDNLQEEWERKIELLKLRVDKLYQNISQHKVDERKLDDYVLELANWLNERFKSPQPLSQAPKIWMEKIKENMTQQVASVEYIVRFFVDNIKLEQCQRGYRVKSEVQGEVIRQLRQSYLYR